MRYPALLVSFALLCTAGPTDAGILDAFESIGEAAVGAATAPIETVINSGKVLTGNAPPNALLDPTKKVLNSGNKALKSLTPSYSTVGTGGAPRLTQNNAQNNAPSNVAADPVVIKCVFPYEQRPIDFYGTRSGRIVVLERSTGQWKYIGFALPPQLSGVAWTYQAQNGTYDVLPNGQIMSRNTPNGPQQVGHVVRFQ